MVDIYCGQTAGMIRMPFGTEVGLGPGDIVLDGDPALPTERAQRPPLFGHVYYDQTVAHLSYCSVLSAKQLYKRSIIAQQTIA